MSKQTKPSIVFAHGLWADGSCFSKLIPRLQAEGHEVMASQHGLDSLASDVAAVKACAWPGSAARRSSSGTPMAARSSRTPGLIRAWPGSSISQPWRRMPTKPRRACRPNPDGVVCFAGDLPEQEQKLVWATQGVPAADLFSQKVDGTAWRSKPSWFIVATKDRTVHPDLERFVAKRMGATMVETASSHVPMLSNPALVLDVIRKAANAVQKSR
jgi:pimeloyl-ACP methyl ester carboxylesterase